MNEWIERSLRVANSAGYLERLTDIYPAELRPNRPLGADIKKQIESLHREGNWQGLLGKLFELMKGGHPFPFEHP